MLRIVSGVVIGAMLSLLRAPLGIELLQWPAVGARAAYGYRALAIVVAALALWAARAHSMSAGWLFAIALGYALHGLALASAWFPAGHASLWIVAILGGAAVLWAAKPRADESSEAAEPALSFLAMTGIFVASAGVAISIEAIARHVRLFGAGLAQDDSVFGTVFLTLVAIGAAAFGWIARAPRSRSLAIPVALSAAAGGGYAAMRVITSAATSRGLDLYLRSYGLDTSLHGTIVYDSLLSASCFVVPALCLGAAFAGVRTREELFSVLLGAAVGLFLVPSFFETGAAASATDVAFFSAQLIPIALLIAVSGAALACLSISSRGNVARWSALSLALLPCILLFVFTVRPQFVVSPWLNRLIMPYLARETPEGFLTVEPSQGGVNVATLDRHAITPATDAVEADARRLLASIEALSPARRVKGDLRVLLIGQLTPPRALVLRDSGATRIDRSAVWWPSMAAVEKQMFDVTPLPAGEIVSPAEAKERIDRGEYDLVVVPPVPGDAPIPSGVRAGANTVVVAWMEFDEPLPRQSLGERVILSANGFGHPSLGVMANASLEGAAIRTLASGRSSVGATPLCRLMQRTFERECESRAIAAERLRDAARGSTDEALTAGLAEFYRAQVRSSPFESSDQQIELPVEALAQLERSALAATPDAFERNLWDEIGRLLVAKRWIPEIYEYVEPVAKRHSPWPMLEHVLARADIESLDPEAAIARLSKLTELEPDHVEHWYYLGEAQEQAKRDRDAVSSWKRSLELQPANSNTKRKIAIALFRLEDPEARRVAEELLLENPEDTEIQSLLGIETPDGTSANGDPHQH